MAIEVVNQVARLIVTGSKNANADLTISVAHNDNQSLRIRHNTGLATGFKNPG